MLLNRIRKALPALGVVVLAGGLATLTTRAVAQQGGVAPIKQGTQISTTKIQSAREAFLENKGQWPSDVLYLAKKAGSNFWVTKSGIVLDAYTVVRDGEDLARRGHVFGIQFEGTNQNVSGSGLEKRKFTTDFVRPQNPDNHGIRGVSSYGSAMVNNLYSGIKMHTYWDAGNPRYDLEVAPGADPSQIRFNYTSTYGTSLAPDGTIKVSTAIGEVSTQGLKVYQKTRSGSTSVVQAKFSQLGPNKFGFKLANYDKSLPLVIDPLIYGTHVGGDTADDYANATVSDLNKNVYVTGRTGSTDFPLTQGPYGVNMKDSADAYMLALTGDAYDVTYVAYVGGAWGDEGNFLQVDQYGGVWMAGTTKSIRMPVGWGTAFTAVTQNGKVPAGGTYRVNFLGTTLSPNVPWNTSAAGLQALLNAVPKAGAADTTVRGIPAGWSLPGTPSEAGVNKYVLENPNYYASPWLQSAFQIGSRTHSYLFDANMPVATMRQETDAENYGFNVNAGTFTITFTRSDQPTSPQTTGPLPWNATSQDVYNAIVALSNVGADNPPTLSTVVTGGPLPNVPIRIRFITGNGSAPWATPQTGFTIDSSLLTSGQYGLTSFADQTFYIRFAPDASTVLNPLGQFVYSVYGNDRNPVETTAFKVRPVATPTGNVDLYFAGYSQSAVPGHPSTFPTGGSYHGYLASTTWNPQTGAISPFNPARSKYFGNNSNSAATGMAIAADGSVYVAGNVSIPGVSNNSLLGPASNVFETTNGIFTNGGVLRGADGFIRKYDPNGNLVYSGVLGGSGSEMLVDLTVDPIGNAYVCGMTDSFNYPRTTGAYGQTFSGGFPNVVVTKVSPSGNQLLYSTNIRQSGILHPKSIAVDSRGDAYIVGHSTPSIVPPITYTPSAPVVTGQLPALNTEFGTSQGFIVVLNSTATGSLFSSSLGGNNTAEVINSVYVDQGSGVWITGESNWNPLSPYYGQYVYRNTPYRNMIATIVPGASSINAVVNVPQPLLGYAWTVSGTGSPSTFGLGSAFTSDLAWKASYDFVAGNDGFMAKLGITQPILQSVSVNPGQIAGGLGATATGTVTLRSAAPAGGTVVTVRVSQPSIARLNSVGGATSVRLTIPAGQTTATFNVFSNRVLVPSFCDIRAELDSDYLVTRLNVRPWLDSLALSLDTVAGGNSLTGTVNLFDVAPAGGVQVLLSSTSPLISFPLTTITVPAGQQSKTFQVDTKGVAVDTQADVVVGVEGLSATQTVKLTPATIIDLTVNPSVINGGETSVGTIRLDGKTVAGATIVLSQTGNPVTIPATIVLPVDQTSTTFNIATSAVTSSSTSTNITAALNGTSAIGVLNFEANDVQSVTLSPSDVVGGTIVTGTVTLAHAAAPSGFIVPMSWSNSAAGTLIGNDQANHPGAVVIPGGAASANFTILTNGVATDQVMTISAHKQGYSARPVTLNVRAVQYTLTLNPTTVSGGSSSTATINLVGQVAGGSGMVFNLSSSSAYATLPASVTIPSGGSSATFQVNTTIPGADTVAAISAQAAAGTTKSANLTILAPSVLSLTLAPQAIDGGGTSVGTVTLNVPAPAGGVVVSLNSSDPSTATVPGSVTVPAGSKTASFNVNTTPVTTDKTVSITATRGSSSKSATLLVRAASVLSLTFNPTSVQGGQTSTGMITLSAAAPAGGITINLTVAGTGAGFVSFPATVTIPAGQTSATFTVSTSQVTRTVAAVFTATAPNGTTASGTVTITTAIGGKIGG